MNKHVLRGLAAVGVLASSAAARADGLDFSGITGAVGLGAVSTAVLAIAALLAVPKVAMLGARMVLRMIGR
ncbi:hypothetical protein [Pelomonas cellulosilytica]|uniref:Phage-related membrane protein n=1 Tax=Pelomonas cellulosilytica TaxID=2906762 RepID=A0ABS8XUP2_9BURK|nr:hypothetical protein [Pelomonas sp. P8]MCE4555010.1 hypothetical protein [Pelomonas sp. P8]